MNAKSRLLPMLVMLGTLGVSACIVHDPYGYGYGGYSRGYRGGYVYSEYPQTRVVHRRYYTSNHYRDDRHDDWRWHDRDHDHDRDYDRDHDGDRWNRHD